MINTNNELIELIKKEISEDVELYTKAHLLCQRGLTIKEFNELDRQDKNFYTASLLYCKEEETKNQVALAKFLNPFLKENNAENYINKNFNSYQIPIDYTSNIDKKEALSKFIEGAFNQFKDDEQYSISYGRKSNNSPVYFSIKDKENDEEINIKVELY